MCKFLWSITAMGVLTFVAVPGQTQADWLSQGLQPARISPPPASYYPPPGYGYPAQGYSQPGYGYFQAPAIAPQYPQGPWRSYYNNPQWLEDWRQYMQSQGTATPGRLTPNYPVQGSPTGYENPPYRSYYSDPQWQQDWREYMERQHRQ